MHDFDELSLPASESQRPVLVVRRSSPFAWFMLLVAVALGGGAAYLLQGERDKARAEAEASRKAAEDVAQNLHGAQAAERALEAQVEQLAQQDKSLAAERDLLSQSVQAKDAELEQVRATYKTLEDKLQTEIKKGDIHLSESNGKVRVDLVDQILFDSGQAALSGRGAEVLLRVANVLTQMQDRQIQVAGHTDDSPISDRLQSTYPTNWELSVMRAVNVVRYLSEHGGVPPNRLVAAGYGQYGPLAPNTSVKGKSRNRRIEIMLMPPLSAKPLGAQPAVAKASIPASTPATPAKRPEAKPTRKLPSRLVGATATRHSHGR